MTIHDIYAAIVSGIDDEKTMPFTNIVIDEAQDISVSQLRFVSALASQEKGGLFFAGDLGQRIFQTPFSWKSLGVDVSWQKATRFESTTEHRTKSAAKRICFCRQRFLMSTENRETRLQTVSAFTGPVPVITSSPDQKSEAKTVGHWISQLVSEGIRPSEIGIVVRDRESVLPGRIMPSLNLA